MPSEAVLQAYPRCHYPPTLNSSDLRGGTVLLFRAVFVSSTARRIHCDVNCDVQVQAVSAKPNKFNGGAFSFRAGSLSYFAIVFKWLGLFLGEILKKLIIPWFGVRIPAGPPITSLCLTRYEWLQNHGQRLPAECDQKCDQVPKLPGF